MKRLVLQLPKWSPRVFEIAHENGCPWDERTCSGAAENGHSMFEICARKGMSLG